MDDVDKRRTDLAGEGSREPGLLRGRRPECNGDRDRAGEGPRASRLVIVGAGDRMLGCV